ncbi:signal transduction histidine kinase/ActR/RegA family two-component response regulator [Sphingopyxis sp. OAS728]|uniref:ATP-binding protein n=1 Tax=Sphingopyxis sp. OAS728 TaxID=2663823 RepID=UPI00178A41E4|nr:ATP-binding protein [Sphingopyxis sp. OAS728]MBE1528910.1 signal transduction histidine kinase/ActR/RegA family two-component response regulator [Sphingopyxis sp. OAS728]
MFERDSDSENDGRRERIRFWSTIVLGAILTGVVGALLVLLARANDNYDRSLGWQTQSMEVISQTRSVDAAIARAEAALGRFAVGLQKSDGRVYEYQWARARQFMTQLRRNVRDNPKQMALVEQLTREMDIRGAQLGDAALSANYNQTVAAISKYYAAGQGQGLSQIDKLLTAIIANERTLLRERNRIAIADRANLNQAILLFSLLGAGAAVIAIGTTFSLIRAEGERRLARNEQLFESDRAMQLEAAVKERTAELAHANDALRGEMIEREAAEAQLRQAQKMEAVGQLTGGIAHDFNNMLAVVVGGLELAQRAPEKASRHLANALDGANRAADLTRRLLTFARSEPARPEMVTIDDCIASFGELIERTIGDRIALTLDLQAAGHACWVDRQQFENALLNLAVNARDAMNGNGSLTIQTLDDGEGKALAVRVIDTGCGMSPEVLERVFDPFYTTKPAGQGTGLGMSQVFAFCRQSGGEVQISSTEGEGTSVAMLLPVTTSGLDAATDTTQGDVAAHPALPDHALNILVVEDDQRVLAATVEAVGELGHTAVACGNPLEAETLVEGQLAEGRNGFDLILTDVLMPKLTGPEMIAQLKQRWPDLPVLFVTGYAGDASEIASFGDHDVLRKPFTLAALDQAIRRSGHPRPTEGQRLAS